VQRPRDLASRDAEKHRSGGTRPLGVQPQRCARPRALIGTSSQPCRIPAMFQSVSPCRTTQIRAGFVMRSASTRIHSRPAPQMRRAASRPPGTSGACAGKKGVRPS
jgi:hypothetical protein